MPQMESTVDEPLKARQGSLGNQEERHERDRSTAHGYERKGHCIALYFFHDGL